VGCTAEGAEAFQSFRKLHPRCVVIDVPVHDSRGFDLLGTLREIDRSCLIVAVTNHASAEFRRRSIDSGADHFLTKSKQFEQLVELVRERGATS
jgi:DNA-binding NarL/FixJ family response regulator